MSYIPRSEHPRPDFKRDNWMSLNGEWDFSIGTSSFDKSIIVPYACESKLSGIAQTGFHPVVWYGRGFTVPDSMHGKRIILHFGAVDYRCWLWVNGELVKSHIGGQSSFSIDITDQVRFDGSNRLELKVEDDPKNMEQLRGKQFWEESSRSIFYTRTTGIWQSVWIEAVDEIHMDYVKITPMFDEKAVRIEYAICGSGDITLETEVFFGETPVAVVSTGGMGNKSFFIVSLEQPCLNAWNFYEDLAWSPENPRLFDVRFRVYEDGKLKDKVDSYFGMRKVSIENGRFLLNNRPYYQKLVLDQGYWPESLMTAPTDEAYIKDIMLIKEMGFNGLRMHQKSEDPRFYYHTDRLGLLVWGEIGSAYIYSCDYAQNMYTEWMENVRRDYNHPSIVAWVPLNESWGVQEIRNDSKQQAHSMAAYYITKSLDSTRVVVDNDGWEHTCGDLLTIHDYEGNPQVIHERYLALENTLKYTPAGKDLYVGGCSYSGQPIIISEYGGVCFTGEGADGWGYSSDSNLEEYERHITSLTAELIGSPYVQGYCYTQFCDIETEQNGLVTYDRRPKLPLKRIRKANQA